MIFDLVAKKMIGFDPMDSRELIKKFEDFFKGMLCFPINFPGTSFYKCMKVHMFELSLVGMCNINSGTLIILLTYNVRGDYGLFFLFTGTEKCA